VLQTPSLVQVGSSSSSPQPAGQLDFSAHESPLHRTSQAQASSQSTPEEQLPSAPEQKTAQRADSHATGPAQLPGPEQLIVQLPAPFAEHRTPPAQARCPMHRTEQGTPAGQTTVSAQESSFSQLITQTPEAQVPWEQTAWQPCVAIAASG
jgi:hypothetical protein